MGRHSSPTRTGSRTNPALGEGDDGRAEEGEGEGGGEGGGAGGTSAGGSGGTLIGCGARVVGAVVVAGRSGAAGDRFFLRGAGRLVAGTGSRAWVVGAITVRAEGVAGSAGGGAASWSTAAPGERAGSDRDWPRVSQPISAHSTAWPTTSATAMRTVRRTVRVTGTGSTRRTLWQAVDVVES